MKGNILGLVAIFVALFAVALAVPPPAGDCPVTTPAENKELVIEMFRKVQNETDMDNLEAYILPSFIQHNPWGRDGAEGLRKDLKPLLEGGGSRGSAVIARSIAADDFVWLHVKLTVVGKPNAKVDIYRIECGKVAEHWDVLQEMVPSKVNDHAYF